MEETLYSLFEKAAEKYRTEIAIIENNRTLTFGELFDLMDMIAESFVRFAERKRLLLNGNIFLIPINRHMCFILRVRRADQKASA